MTPPALTTVPAGATANGQAIALPQDGPSPLERLLQKGRLRATLAMLGPAFVASVAYVDPGNFATNVQGGARFGYALLWVVLLANAMAMLVQYLSAKLGIATDRSLPQLCRERYPRSVSWGLWLQAELMAMSTDVAEFLGAAVGLNLLFGVPLFAAGLITGVIAFGVLELQRRGVRRFELAITALLAIVLAGFLYETLRIGPSAPEALRGLIPSFGGTTYLYLAVGIIGATVMPHAIYLHSALTNGRMPLHQGQDPAVAAPPGDDGPRTGDPRARRQPDERTRAQPGRAVVRNTLRAPAAGGVHQLAYSDGSPRQPPPDQCRRIRRRRSDHRHEPIPDLPAAVRMSLAKTFEDVVQSLPDDWTDLEFDLRIFDERRYIDAAVLLVTCNAQPYSKHDWHWRLLVAHRFGHAASVPAVHTALKLLDEAEIDGELAVREVRTGRVEVVQMWGRPESVRQEFKRIRAQ